MESYFAECHACLGDQIVDDADVLDAGMVFGTGFAPFRGGPLHYLRERDAAQATKATAKEPQDRAETATEESSNE